MSAPVPTVTLTVSVRELRQLFAGGNHSGGGAMEGADPLMFALDIIEHGAMELYTLHDALKSAEERTEDLADHMWRLSEQLKSGLALVLALQKETVSS